MIINTVIEIHNVNIIKQFVKYLTVYVIIKYIYFLLFILMLKNPFKFLNFLSFNFFFNFFYRYLVRLDLHSSFIQICDFRLHFTTDCDIMHCVVWNTFAGKVFSRSKKSSLSLGL